MSILEDNKLVLVSRGVLIFIRSKDLEIEFGDFELVIDLVDLEYDSEA
jgi:hypothetical protein